MTKGQFVVRTVEAARWKTEDVVGIERVDQRGIWLACGLGGVPAGPFDPTTGEFLGEAPEPPRAWIKIAVMLA